MSQNVIFPLLIGVVFLISVVAFKYLPLREGLRKFRQAFMINYLCLGIFSLIIALLSAVLKLDILIVLYIVVGGVVVSGFATIIPVAIKMAKYKKY
jgi:lysylphosphatidylglycerol synthetase-like protein (DUF2156 family)